MMETLLYRTSMQNVSVESNITRQTCSMNSIYRPNMLAFCKFSDGILELLPKVLGKTDFVNRENEIIVVYL